MGIKTILAAFNHRLSLSGQETTPLYLQETVAKMEVAIGRLENTANLNLFQTDYLD